MSNGCSATADKIMSKDERVPVGATKTDEEPEKPLTLWRRIKRWNASPMFTPRWALVVLGVYTSFYVIAGVAILVSTTNVVDIVLEYRKSPLCSGASSEPSDSAGDAATVTGRTCKDISSGSTGNAAAVESITFRVEQDMEGPILMFYEYEDFHQNHRRYVSSVQSPASLQQYRTGSCMPYQKEHGYGCEAKENNRGPGSANEFENAIYHYWRPKTLEGDGGCKYWWSTNSTQCLAGNDAICDAKPTGLASDNRVYYPCGLGARAYGEGHDSFSVESGAAGSGLKEALSSKHEDVVFEVDWRHRYRNLDPEATYDKTDARTDADDGGSALHGMEFQKILDMHLLKQFPPVVCADDSLGLLSPDVKSDWPTPQCENYRGFQFDTATNAAECTYSNPSGVVDPITGSAITCQQKVAAEAGWGIENSHFINWQRISGMSVFRKLYAKIPGPWKKGEVKTLHVANRMDFAQVLGSTDVGKKSVIFQTATFMGGSFSYIGGVFLAIGMVCCVLFALVLRKHVKDPRAIEKVMYMEWHDYR